MNKLYYLILLFNTACFNANSQKDMIDKKEIAIFANGCFWCTEAIFQNLKGVESVKPGYIGGDVDNPTYEQVCTGNTNHAEALQISFNPDEVSYSQLLEVFFSTHNPTTLNRQGNDIGTQYRSEIFFTNNNQKDEALKMIQWIESQNIFEDPIVTEVSEASRFWIAEDYHHNYYNNNKEKSYCAMVIQPKVEKFKMYFSESLK